MKRDCPGVVSKNRQILAAACVVAHLLLVKTKHLLDDRQYLEPASSLSRSSSGDNSPGIPDNIIPRGGTLGDPWDRPLAHGPRGQEPLLPPLRLDHPGLKSGSSHDHRHRKARTSPSNPQLHDPGLRTPRTRICLQALSRSLETNSLTLTLTPCAW